MVKGTHLLDKVSIKKKQRKNTLWKRTASKGTGPEVRQSLDLFWKLGWLKVNEEKVTENEGRWRGWIRPDLEENAMSLDFFPSRWETTEGFRQEMDMIWFSLTKISLAAPWRMDWKRAKTEAKRPVKRPLQLPRQQMVARTKEMEWRQTELFVFKSYYGSVIYWDRDNKTWCLPSLPSQNLVFPLSIWHSHKHEYLSQKLGIQMSSVSSLFPHA